MRMLCRSVQRLSSPARLRTLSSNARPQFFPGAVVECRGDMPYGSREYILLPPHVSLADLDAAENKHLKLASLHAHRNIIFGAAVHYQPPRHEDDDLDPDSKTTLLDACLPLLDAALLDASSDGEQPQAVSSLHGLCCWVNSCIQGRKTSETLSKLQAAGTDEAAVSIAAVQSVASKIPRPGHSVVGQGTYRDAATAWEALAREFVKLARSEECQLYQARGAELVGIELLADTRPDYMNSAGGSMARFFFL